MGIPQPKYNLGINGKGHGAMTGAMLAGLEEVVLAEQPHYLMVYGDTNSTLAGALVAKKLHIKVIHVEAGLRSFNMAMPEEINRILTDRISDLLFCPTDTAVENLHHEGFKHFDCEIHKCGDVMFDASLHYLQRSQNQSTLLQDLELQDSSFALCTIHRSENTDDWGRLKDIMDTLNELSQDYNLICPLHPRTRQILQKRNYTLNFKVIDPVGYLDILQLLNAAELVVTDSGGMQKEAYFLQKYCITLRDQTEWVELVDLGVNTLVGANPDQIADAFKENFGRTVDNSNHIYGDGNACSRICETLLTKL